MEHLDSTVNPPVVSVVSEMSAVVRSLLDTRLVQICLWRFSQLVVSGHSQFNCCCPDWPETAFQGFSNGCNWCVLQKARLWEKPRAATPLEIQRKCRRDTVKRGCNSTMHPSAQRAWSATPFDNFWDAVPPGLFFWHQCSVLPTSKLAQRRFLLDMIWWCSKWYVYINICSIYIYICIHILQLN